MKLSRKTLLSKLQEFVLQSNGVIVGSPGVGKSHSLKEITKNLSKKKIPVLYLPIDKLGDISSSLSLQEALEIETDLVAFLKEQTVNQGQKGILIFDAYDAARSEKVSDFYLRTIRKTILELNGDWNIVVSVREYDAQRSIDLLDLFELKKEEVLLEDYQKSDISCRHFYIPRLNSNEIVSAAKSISKFDFYEKLSNEIKEILSLPFYLSLVEKILASGSDYSELSLIQSEVQLLNLFWKYNKP